jgi:hypothetical protein
MLGVENVHTILVEKSEGARPLASPTYRWKGNTKTDLKNY